MYDAIVVGARCGGSPLARLLALGGAKVLLVDRASFPSEIPHGHFIHRWGPRRLKEWGLLDRVAAVCEPATRHLVDLGDFPLVAGDLVENGIAWGYGPRRGALDKILVDAAAESGVELRDGFTVEEFLFDGDRVVGIRGRAANGAPVEERATLTIGADGRNSRLAKAVGAPVYDSAPTLLCYYFSYWSGVESHPYELYQRSDRKRVLFTFRTSGNLFAIFVGFPIEELPAMRSDIERRFMDALELVPDLAERVRSGRREERFYGATDLPNFYRKPYGPGWALVGDAGCHKDPFMALGISDAFRDAGLLASAIADGLSGRLVMEDALAAFERRRNEMSMTEYRQNLSAARFEPLPPEVFLIRQAVRSNPAEATRMSKARYGMIDPKAFFNPQTMQQLLGERC